MEYSCGAVLYTWRDGVPQYVLVYDSHYGFPKGHIEPGESKTVEFTIGKKEMGFYNNEAEYRLEDGLFRFYAGGDSRNCLMAEVNVKF